MAVLSSLMLCYLYFPDANSYFDQVSGSARITRIDHNDFSIVYFNKTTSDSIRLNGRVKDQRKLKKKEVGSQVSIQYSNSDPKNIYIENLTPKPWIGGLGIIAICLVCIALTVRKIYS